MKIFIFIIIIIGVRYIHISRNEAIKRGTKEKRRRTIRA